MEHCWTKACELAVSHGFDARWVIVSLASMLGWWSFKQGGKLSGKLAWLCGGRWFWTKSAGMFRRTLPEASKVSELCQAVIDAINCEPLPRWDDEGVLSCDGVEVKFTPEWYTWLGKKKQGSVVHVKVGQVPAKDTDSDRRLKVEGKFTPQELEVVYWCAVTQRDQALVRKDELFRVGAMSAVKAARNPAVNVSGSQKQKA